MIDNSATAYFYFSPKFHKNLTKFLGRPIIAGMDNLISEYVDRFLEKYVWSLPAYLRDSGHLLSLLEEIKWKEGMVLETLDIAAYSKILHEKGVRVVGDGLDFTLNITFLFVIIHFIFNIKVQQWVPNLC